MKRLLLTILLLTPLTAYGALPATDNFNRADSANLGANWTAVTNNMQIVSNAVQGTVFAGNLVYWSADAFGNDHYAQTKQLSVSGGGPAVRVSAGSNAYFFYVSPGNTAEIYKRVSGTNTSLQSGITSPANNDTTYMEVIGTSIKVKINGVQVGTTQVDSSLASGSAGYFDYDTQARYDDFQADNLGSTVVAATQEVLIKGVAVLIRGVAVIIKSP